MSTITSWTREHRLPVFFILTFVVSWWVVAVLRDGYRPHPVLRLRPAGRRPGRHRDHRRSLRLPRAGRPDDPLAGRLDLVGGRARPAAGRAGRRDRWPMWRIWGAPAPVLAIIGFGGYRDELRRPVRQSARRSARRGAGLARLRPAAAAAQAAPRWSSAVLLGVVVALWHLPLVAAGQLAAIGLVVTFAITLVYTWLFNHTGGSVLLTMVFHVAQGAVQHRRPSVSPVRTPPGWTGSPGRSGV